ncbi:restriction endonuclease subunit S [Pseudomonas aeruginosa]|uniref:restriction endonuclease subunit S n=1 Tax=Pseudomonas aeruginosa TaxID=287 RepID=UPI000FD27F34|nr:restriction endonuclease subunit S [Pseudomonas aeruginosa]RUJ34641.1 restriction endonuclease subunit S [Pseudomonas aeruginosa]
MERIPEMLPFPDVVDMVKVTGKIKKADYLSYSPGRIAVIDQGEGLIGGYTDDHASLVPVNDPVIVFGDHTCRFKYVDFPFAAGADGTQIFKARDGFSTKYIYYACLAAGVDLHGYQRHFKHLKASLLPVFELEVQRSIAHVLYSYDELIENNTRRIEILEEMARRLYEEWFVQFRFPGHEGVEFKESELGLAPKGWSPATVKSLVVRLKGGKTYKSEELQGDGSIIVVDQSRAEYLGFHDNEPSYLASPKTPAIIFGDHTCKMQVMVTPFSVGPNTVVFAGQKGHSPYYIYSLVRGLVSTAEYKRHWSDLTGKIVLEAPATLSTSYGEMVSPMFGEIELLRRKNRNLRAQRDLLLPKLISGEIDVSDIPMPT